MIVRITSRYGAMESFRSQPHTGIDLAFPEGTPLQSVGEAVVERIVDYGNQNIGKGVILRLSDGKEAIYGHLSNNSLVKVGQKLNEGDIVGLSGNTGNVIGNGHLHFGLKDNGEFIDPTSLAQKFIERGSVEQYDYPTIWGYLGEKILSGGFQHWIENYIISLPILLGVSIGVFGLLSMVNRKIATWGIGFVMVLGGVFCI